MWLGRQKELAVSTVDKGSDAIMTSVFGKTSALHWPCLPDSPNCSLLCATARASFCLDYTCMCWGHILETPRELTLHLCKHYATTTTEIWDTPFKFAIYTQNAPSPQKKKKTLERLEPSLSIAAVPRTYLLFFISCVLWLCPGHSTRFFNPKTLA